MGIAVRLFQQLRSDVSPEPIEVAQDEQNEGGLGRIGIEPGNLLVTE